jgi:hypothetical protein
MGATKFEYVFRFFYELWASSTTLFPFTNMLTDTTGMLGGC